MVEVLEYTGKVQPSKGEKDSKTGLPIYPYLPSDELVEAVNLAIILERPLLIQGEPGCGKTQLAQAVVYELNVAYELELEYFVWNIKSTSTAQDGLYTYDNLARLRDVQLLSQVQDEEAIKQVKDPKTYRKFGKLGEAFTSEKRAVLLIDEIDKADIDFPNDLLLELDQKTFTIPETGEKISANYPPIIFITSNQERDLPDAFLRRCLFHYLEFPDKDHLIDIIKAHFDIEGDDPVAERAVTRFLELRKLLETERTQVGKNTSTSELIDWFKILRSKPEDEALQKLEGQLPYLGVLLKRWEDHERYIKKFSESTSRG